MVTLEGRPFNYLGKRFAPRKICTWLYLVNIFQFLGTYLLSAFLGVHSVHAYSSKRGHVSSTGPCSVQYQLSVAFTKHLFEGKTAMYVLRAAQFTRFVSVREHLHLKNPGRHLQCHLGIVMQVNGHNSNLRCCPSLFQRLVFLLGFSVSIMNMLTQTLNPLPTLFIPPFIN